MEKQIKGPNWTTKLGKISHVSFGEGGYQDACFGLSLTLEGSGWGVNDFKGGWNIERTERCKWTEEDRNQEFLETINLIRDSLKKSQGLFY